MIKKFEMLPGSEWFDYDLKITLKPSFRCNQKCWFCDEWDNSTPMWTSADCDLVIDKLKSVPEEKKRIFIYLYGGEPTLNKNWEYIHYRIIELFPEKILFIQTQTNLSISNNRLEVFFRKINKLKNSNHTIDICSSYHMSKQTVEDFAAKLRMCEKNNSLGYCFFSTEICKEDQFIREFKYLSSLYPHKIKLKFTQLENMSDSPRPEYIKLLEDDYLKGDDNGEGLEYRYFIKKYPELERYLEHDWSFDVDGEIINYSEVKSRGIHRQLKYMKCMAGTKNIVIDHNLNVYRCNDYYYSEIQTLQLDDLNFNTFLDKPNRCLSCKCTDGLDHTKIR